MTKDELWRTPKDHPVALLKSPTLTKISVTLSHGLMCIAEMQDGLYCPRNIEMPEIYIPTRSEIEAIMESDLAPNCFRHWRQVTKVYADRSNTVISMAYGKAVCHRCGY